jgi:hypothetical protein
MSGRALAAVVAFYGASAFQVKHSESILVDVHRQVLLENISAVSQDSLPPLQGDFPKDAFKPCKNDQLEEWKARGDNANSVIKTWMANNDGAIVKDTGASSCLAGGNPSSNGKVMTLVKEPEEQQCTLSPQGRKPEEGEFTVSGKMAKTSPTRKYQIMWPAESKCTKSNPCPVMFFFHGCASMVLPMMQAQADDKCFDSLNSVMIIPKLLKEEKWTEHGTSVLEEFVMPLWAQVKKEYGEKLDVNRVAAAGASLGSGMALQAALLRPDIFSMSIAVGLADGSHCEDGPGGKVEFDGSAILAGNSVPHDSSKLKGIVVVMSEKETELDSRLAALLNILDENSVTKDASLHMRLYGDAGHATGILYTFNQWAGMHDTIFSGKF